MKHNVAENLSHALIKRILRAIGLTTLFWIIALPVAYLLYHANVYMDDSIIYIAAQLFKVTAVVLIPGIYLLEVILICYRAWKQSLSYLDDMMDASRQLIRPEVAHIELPAALEQVETQMNLVKYEAIHNAMLTKEAEQRKNDLIVYLAHDLKTPLTSVIGYMTLLRDEKALSEEMRTHYTEIALDRALRLEELINEFFEIARFNLSTVSLELTTVNMTRMLEQIVSEFLPLLEEKRLSCQLQTTPDCMLCCDVNKMERVIDNLIRNAINYSYPDSAIEILLAVDVATVTMVFRNHGNTIPPDKLQRIFEQFYRVDAARGTQTGGAGLGLAISKQIVEQHHGEITAESANENISFQVKLPRTATGVRTEQ